MPVKIAIDVEMIEGVGKVSLPGRVSLVDEHLRCIYDTYVKPSTPVVDYRTQYSGLTEAHLRSGVDANRVRTEVSNKIQGCILIGHSVADVDLKVLQLEHPSRDIRDVAQYPPFTQGGQKRSLKDLARRELNLDIQDGPHSSVEDAKTAMRLYKKVENQWR